jgi:prephenate dehydrogenase
VNFPEHSQSQQGPSLGIIGLGAFGQLCARYLRPWFRVLATDPGITESPVEGVTMADLQAVCRCDLVVIAVPLSVLTQVCREIAPLLRPGTVVMDVCSTKVQPAEILCAELPPHVDLIATHPMFGPQSIRAGTKGLKMVICPLRGRAAGRVAAFLRKRFGLSIVLASPEEHDREAAFTQGLTHLIAKALLRMDPLPARITTRSFDLIRQAVEMVRHDAPGVSHAIESNPFSAQARSLFFAEMDAVRVSLEPPCPTAGSAAPLR